jgi:hypothetical protein
MGKAELSETIADLEEQAERQKSEIMSEFSDLKRALQPKNIAKRAAFNIMSKVRGIFHFKKKPARTTS